MGERGIALTDNIVNLLLVFEAVVFQIYIQILGMVFQQTIFKRKFTGFKKVAVIN
jgi:hypothetical protein